MRRRVVAPLVLAALTATLVATAAPVRVDAAADACHAAPEVTASHAGLDGTTAAMAFDGDVSTGFVSSHDDWQHIDIAFPCSVDFAGLRRHISRHGSTSGVRAHQGETIVYRPGIPSQQRVTEDPDLANNHNGRCCEPLWAWGWEEYTNYGVEDHAWHSVDYGWSDWLRVETIDAYTLRYRWDGAPGESLNEIELDAVHRPGHLCDFTTATVTGDQPGLAGTTHAMTYDQNLASAFRSGHDNWQYVQIDFPCIVGTWAFQRHMTLDGSSSWRDDRGLQGESLAYRTDPSAPWTPVTAATSSGWEGYANYGAAGQAWTHVNLGWSNRLILEQTSEQPFEGKFVTSIRYSWDGNHAQLDEGLDQLFFNIYRNQLHGEWLGIDTDFLPEMSCDTSVEYGVGAYRCTRFAPAGAHLPFTVDWAIESGTATLGTTQSLPDHRSTIEGTFDPAQPAVISVEVVDADGGTDYKDWLLCADPLRPEGPEEEPNVCRINRGP